MSREEEGSNANRISDFHGGHGSSCLVGRPKSPAASVEPIPPVLRLWPLAQLAAPHLPGACRLDGSGDRPERRRLALALDRAGSRRHCVGRARGPVLIYLHPIFGSKRLGTRYLFHRLAGEGWICVGANYRRASDDEFSDPLIDVKKVIAWMREHGPEYGADPTAIFVAGSSLGGHLAALAACMPCDPMLQPDSRVRTPRLPASSPCTATTETSLLAVRQLHDSPTRRRTRHRASSRMAIETRSSSSRTHAFCRTTARHFLEPGGLRRAARRATRVRPIPLPTLRHCRRCDRGIRSLHRLRWEPDADEIEVGRRVPHLRLCTRRERGPMKPRVQAVR